MCIHYTNVQVIHLKAFQMHNKKSLLLQSLQTKGIPL